MRCQQRCLVSCRTSSKIFLLGFILGCTFFVLTRFAVMQCYWSLDHTIPAGGEWQHDFISWTPTSTTDENLVLIGVMSAKQFLEPRVIPIFDTWAKTIPGKVSCLRYICKLVNRYKRKKLIVIFVRCWVELRCSHCNGKMNPYDMWIYGMHYQLSHSTLQAWHDDIQTFYPKRRSYVLPKCILNARLVCRVLGVLEFWHHKRTEAVIGNM